MTQLKFYNKLGEINLFGGGSTFPFRLTSIDGLGLPDKNAVVVNYVGYPGQTTTSLNVGSRTITIAGDVPADHDIQRKLSNAMIILNTEGTLLINVGYVSRKIKCRCSAATLGERNGAYQTYAMQFICDYPYFEDLENTYLAVFDIIPQLSSAFRFPGIFSKRISRGNITVMGSAEVEPIFYIDVDEVGEMTAQNGISITNHTTGQSLQLDYAPYAGERITIQVPDRKIYNNNGDDLLKYITNGTFLNGMTLVPGDNDIEVLNYSTTTNLTVLCEYSNKYVEAVW